MSGSQPGDPALAAEAMIRADADGPPLRLPLGEYTLRRIRDK